MTHWNPTTIYAGWGWATERGTSNVDLRDYTAEELLGELSRRARERQARRCSHCGRKMHSEPPCDALRDHSPVRTSQVTVQGRLELAGPKGSGKTVMAEVFRRAAEECDVDLVIVEIEREL